jgi:hypothetical protein
MRQILTDAACKTKRPRTGRLEIADLRQAGLVLRITANGARSFAFRFRHPVTRKSLRATIGSYPAMSLEAARNRAKEMAAQVEAGTNPIETKKVEREQAPTRGGIDGEDASENIARDVACDVATKMFASLAQAADDECNALAATDSKAATAMRDDFGRKLGNEKARTIAAIAASLTTRIAPSVH